MEEITGDNIYYRIEQQLPGQLAFFISGALLYYYYDKFKQNSLQYLLIALVVYALSTYLSLYPLVPISLAVIVIYFATSFKYLGNWGRYGDFSYGVYIWHYPILQVLVVYGIFSIGGEYAFILSFVVVMLAAFFSWHIIEKPFLKSNSHYVVVESKFK